MSERITAANLDEVIKRNEVIEEQMKQSASLIWSKYNPILHRDSAIWDWMIPLYGLRM